MRSPRRSGVIGKLTLLVVATSVAGGLVAGVGSSLARADHLQADETDEELNPFEELSYEVIIEPGTGYSATMKLRVALLNTSASTQDFVMHLAAPRDAELLGLRVNVGADWRDAGPAQFAARRNSAGQGRRVFARQLAPSQVGDLSSVQLVGTEIASDEVVQIELVFTIWPEIVGERFSVDLPRRGPPMPSLRSDRRVLVKGRAHDPFWVDGIDNNEQPFMVSQARDVVTVAWPAHIRASKSLTGRYETFPDMDARGDGGDLQETQARVYLAAGDSTPLRPDHVTVIVDRSASMGAITAQSYAGFLSALVDRLPERTTIDVLAFARLTTPLLGSPARGGQRGLSERLAKAIVDIAPAPGSDLIAALGAAADRLSASRATAPAILVVTDGMLPEPDNAAALLAELARRAGKSKPPDIVFVVSDPTLLAEGLRDDHPIARLATALNARISLASMDDLARADVDPLAAPRIMANLEVVLPRDATVLGDLPDALIAGETKVIHAQLPGRAPKTIEVRAKVGRSKVSKTLRANPRPPPPSALVALLDGGTLDPTTSVHMSLPSWWTRQMTDDARLSIEKGALAPFDAKGSIDQRIVERALAQRVTPRVQACYRLALARHPTLGGRAVLRMEVGKGETMLAQVTDLKLSAKDDEFVGCLREAAWQLVVPAANLDASTYVVRYPVQLTPPAGAKEPTVYDGNDPFVDLLLKRRGATPE